MSVCSSSRSLTSVMKDRRLLKSVSLARVAGFRVNRRSSSNPTVVALPLFFPAFHVVPCGFHATTRLLQSHERVRNFDDDDFHFDELSLEQRVSESAAAGATGSDEPVLSSSSPSEGAHQAARADDPLIEESREMSEKERALQDAVLKQVSESTPIPSPSDIQELLREAKTSSEVRRVLNDVVYRHPLAFDVLNGHGYRVAILSTLNSVAPKTHAIDEWFDAVDRFRKLGFEITRSYVAEGHNLIRAHIQRLFHTEGRSPQIIASGLNRMRQLAAWAREDRLVLDFVVYSRSIVTVTMMVSFFDRQNLYRANFSDDFVRRDGVVFEWVVGHTRCVDFDQAVALCNDFVEEIIQAVQEEFHCRPTFSFLYRLMDYYFATDQPEKMIQVAEDAEQCGITIAESTTAKIMQLACAFNLPNTYQLFLKYRAALPQCVLAAPDASRLLFFYSRSGGGKPCPACGEPYNHRHQGHHVWVQTPPHQRECELLACARTRKSEYEDRRDIPQSNDHSAFAKALRKLLVDDRQIQWGTHEWRGYLLCHMFAKDSGTALEALQQVDVALPEPQFDEFLRQAYIRVLRHHRPEALAGVMNKFFEGKPVAKVSPIVLQEALMTAALISDSSLRADLLARLWRLVKDRDSYVMSYTSRVIRRTHDQRLLQQQLSNIVTVSASEQALVAEILTFKPRSVNLLDVKDGVSDFTVGSAKKNVFVASSAERGNRDARQKDREEYKKRRASVREQK